MRTRRGRGPSTASPRQRFRLHPPCGSSSGRRGIPRFFEQAELLSLHLDEPAEKLVRAGPSFCVGVLSELTVGLCPDDLFPDSDLLLERRSLVLADDVCHPGGVKLASCLLQMCRDVLRVEPLIDVHLHPRSPMKAMRSSSDMPSSASIRASSSIFAFALSPPSQRCTSFRTRSSSGRSLSYVSAR